MGLVSTWLNGIGLRSVVPTFEAAGIVSPSHLADLDVSYFESLGVTDPDDRRKLFYLVQRIKLAVNNKEDSNSGVAERVDAVVSESFVNEDDENKEQGNFMDEHDDFDAKNSSKEPFLEETKDDGKPLRRSRRIKALKKKKPKKNISKEKKDEGTKKSRDPAALGIPKNGSLSHTNDLRNGESETKKELMENTLSKHSKRSPKKKSSSKLKKKDKVLLCTQNISNDSEILSAPTDIELTSKDHDISIIDDTNDEVTEQPNINEKNNPTISQMLQKTDLSRRSRNQVNSRQQPQSKLPVSIRSGRRLQATTTQQNSSQSSITESSSSLLNHPTNDVQTIKTEISDSKAKRRVTLAADLHSLSNTFKSSRDEVINSKSKRNGAIDLPGASRHAGDDKEMNNEQDGTGSTRRITSSRSSKSMGVSESVLLQQYQHSHLKRSSISSTNKTLRPSPTTTAKQAPSSNVGGMRTSSNRSVSIPLTSTVVVTQGTSEVAESWAAKIHNLREDNDAEHELFRDQVDDESQYHEYYDMRIKVIVRKRPLSKTESLTAGIDIIHPLDYGSYGKALVYQPKTRVDLTKEVETIHFAFDNVFNESSTNIGIYNRSLRNLVEPFFQGQWATVFAYGQTGSGKTYTMMGSNITGINAGTATVDESNLGLYYLAALDIFEMKKLPEYSHFDVHVSLFEIYSGKLLDLLNDRKQIKCLEDGKGKVCFPGLTEHSVHAPEHVMHLIEEGSKNRSTGTTSRNADSSRSHAVLQIKLIKSAGRKTNIEHGRFSFIDLAGNERGADTSNAKKATRLEGAEINTSLLALKEVIRALATGGSMTHIPFRGSKLTQVLKDSFVGKNSRCCMVACISPDMGNCEQTLNTLRYADRVKERDSESGVLPASCQQPTRISKLATKTVSQLNSDDTIKRQNYDENLTDNGRDYLSQPSPQNQQPEKLSYEMKLTEKQRAGHALVMNHRSVMTQWLAMVKDEMNLVNQVDADRECLDDYIVRLQNMQRIQIDFLSELRSSLQKYVRAAEGSHHITAHHDDDESFEDLRD